MTLGIRIRQFRDELGMTQEEFAEHFSTDVRNFTARSLQGWESDEHIIDLKNIRLICKENFSLYNELLSLRSEAIDNRRLARQSIISDKVLAKNVKIKNSDTIRNVIYAGRIDPFIKQNIVSKDKNYVFITGEHYSMGCLNALYGSYIFLDDYEHNSIGIGVNLKNAFNPFEDIKNLQKTSSSDFLRIQSYIEELIDEHIEDIPSQVFTESKLSKGKFKSLMSDYILSIAIACIVKGDPISPRSFIDFIDNYPNEREQFRVLSSFYQTSLSCSEIFRKGKAINDYMQTLSDDTILNIIWEARVAVADMRYYVSSDNGLVKHICKSKKQMLTIKLTKNASLSILKSLLNDLANSFYDTEIFFMPDIETTKAQYDVITKAFERPVPYIHLNICSYRLNEVMDNLELKAKNKFNIAISENNITEIHIPGKPIFTASSLTDDFREELTYENINRIDNNGGI